MITHYITNQQKKLEKIDTFKKGCWINIEDPTNEEIDQLIQQFHFPRDYVTSILDDQEISRQEGLEDSNQDTPILLLVQYPHLAMSNLGYTEFLTYPFSFILTPDAILTVSKYPSKFISDIFENDNDQTIDTAEQEHFVLRLLFYISASFVHYLNDIQKEINRLEAQMKIANENQQIYALLALQKSLIRFKAALISNEPVLKTMGNNNVLFEDDKYQDFLHDVMVENEQARTMAAIQDDVLEKVSIVFSSVVSNNLNNIMKVLTSITIVLTIPTIIGGIYGMNVALPFEHVGWAFWGIMVITILICLITIWILKKKKFF